MDCEGITNKILDFQAQGARLDADFADGSGELDTYLPIYESLEQKIEELIDELNSMHAKEFFAYLEKPEVVDEVERIFAMVQIETERFTRALSPEREYEFYQMFSWVFNDLQIQGTCNSQSYEKFVEKIAEFSPSIELLGNYKVMLNSIFLNKFTKGQTIRYEKSLPTELADNYGMYLESGVRVILDKVDRQVGYGLRGGVIHVRESGKGAGQQMQSGKIFIHGYASTECGWQMSGGFLFAAEAGMLIGHEMKNGFLYTRKAISAGKNEGGIILSDARIHDGVTGRKLDRIWWKGDSFPRVDSNYYTDDNNVNLPTVVNNAGNVIRQAWENANLFDTIYLVEEYWQREFNPTRAMERGVVILRGLPHVIGLDMTGGTVIIEVPDITIEDVKRRISKHKKGGAILLRVLSDDGESTKLVDVEEAEYYPRVEADKM